MRRGSSPIPALQQGAVLLLLFLLSALLKVFEVAEGNDKLTRLNTAKDITETVKSLQQFAMIRHHFKRWDRQTLTH